MTLSARIAAIALVLACFASTQAATITDLTQWTEVADPADPGLTAVVDSPAQATLEAMGSIPSGVDIGFKSVDGVDVASSTSGYYFSPNSDFAVAIDFSMSSLSSTGGSGIGFGIGEDDNGTNSAGIGLALVNALPTLIASAGRTNNVDEPIQTFAATPMNTGRFFVRYNSTTGDVTVGVSATPGSGMAEEAKTLPAVQDGWDDEPLLVSFFLRSQAISVIPGLGGTRQTAVFSNFEVLEGSPISVPEPTATLLFTSALAIALNHRQQPAA